MNNSAKTNQKADAPAEVARRFAQGRDYWWQYTKLNGYAFEPNGEGLKKLSRNLDLNIPHLRKCINAFLEAA
jgi:hypothetical protein